MMKITIAGDYFVSTNDVSNILVDSSVMETLRMSDYSFLNFEAPILCSGKAKAIKKTGPNINMGLESVDLAQKMGFNVFTLANNHILDFGESALLNTLKICSERSILNVGAGENIQNAQQALILKKDDVSVAVINACESEWSIASDNMAGANPLDIVEIANQIKRLKKTADFVIVIIHGGHEYYKYPSPRMVKTYRFFVDQGANAVIGHHTHCIGGYELYNDAPIFYSLGNFLFYSQTKDESWNTGLLCSLSFKKGSAVTAQCGFTKFESIANTIKICGENEEGSLLEQIKSINEIISDEKMLRLKWEEYVDNHRKTLRIFSPLFAVKFKKLRSILFRLGFDRILENKSALRIIHNSIRCEAHRDLVLQLFSQTQD